MGQTRKLNFTSNTRFLNLLSVITVTYNADVLDVCYIFNEVLLQLVILCQKQT